MGCIGRFIGAFFLLCVSVYPATAEPRIALVIANGAYAGDIAPIPHASNDGKLIAATLQKLGFRTTIVSDVDQSVMKRAINEFAQSLVVAGPSTTGVFYYVGQGAEIDQESYLIPLNATFEDAIDFDISAVTASFVMKQMDYAGIATNIVILDAGRTNPTSQTGRKPYRHPLENTSSEFFVSYSTAPGDVTTDGDGTNAPFAAALADEMLKPGVAIEEVFRNVRNKVMSATDHRQTPWEYSSLVHLFHFVGAAN